MKVDRAASKLTSYWRDLTTSERMDVSEAPVEGVRKTGRRGPYEKEYLRDGSRSWMLFSGRELGDGTIVEFAIDVSDRKKAHPADA